MIGSGRARCRVVQGTRLVGWLAGMRFSWGAAVVERGGWTHKVVEGLELRMCGRTWGLRWMWIWKIWNRCLRSVASGGSGVEDACWLLVAELVAGLWSLGCAGKQNVGAAEGGLPT